jgi:hypothetical protein
MPDATITSKVFGATSVETQQQEASVLAFTVPPATSGSSFSFSISAVEGVTLGTITPSDLTNLQVSGSTVTVLSGFTGTGTVTVHLGTAFVNATTFSITRSSGSAQTGTQTSLDVNKFGWFLVTALGSGASFEALSMTVTGLPSNEGVQIYSPKPLFLIPSVTGTDYSFTIGNTAMVENIVQVAAGSGLTQSSNTVTATSDLTEGMRSFVTVTYVPHGQTQSTTTQFAVQRLGVAGTGEAMDLQVGNQGAILVLGLPEGVQVRGNNMSYQTTEAGSYEFSFVGEGGVTLSSVAFHLPNASFDVTLGAGQTSVVIGNKNPGGSTPEIIEFGLRTNLGNIDPQIAVNPDDDWEIPPGPQGE